MIAGRVVLYDHAFYGYVEAFIWAEVGMQALFTILDGDALYAYAAAIA